MKSLKFLACAASSLLFFSSCKTMSDIFGQIFEPTESVYATVEHASAPKYHSATYTKKGEPLLDAYYTQNINVRTDDGRRLRGTHNYDEGDEALQLYTGARGQATIGLKSGRLKRFEVSY